MTRLAPGGWWAGGASPPGNQAPAMSVDGEGRPGPVPSRLDPPHSQGVGNAARTVVHFQPGLGYQ